MQGPFKFCPVYLSWSLIYKLFFLYTIYHAVYLINLHSFREIVYNNLSCQVLTFGVYNRACGL